MGWIVKEISNGGSIEANPISLRTTQVILMPIISFQNKVLRLGYRRKQSRLEGLLPRVLDKVTKHRTETSAIRPINNLMIDNYKLVDRKIFLGLI